MKTSRRPLDPRIAGTCTVRENSLAQRACRFALLFVAAWVLTWPPRAILLAQSSQKKEDAQERRLRNEIKERDEHIRKLKKELDEKEAEVKKLQQEHTKNLQELTVLRKRPMVPTDNIALAPYDTHQLFAKDQPSGTGPVIFQFKKGATLLLVWKHSDGKSESGKSSKWEFATVRLTAESNTRELGVNLHKGSWSVYRSNPKAGYVHVGDIQVSDKAIEVPVPDAD